MTSFLSNLSQSPFSLSLGANFYFALALMWLVPPILILDDSGRSSLITSAGTEPKTPSYHANIHSPLYLGGYLMPVMRAP